MRAGTGFWKLLHALAALAALGLSESLAASQYGPLAGFAVGLAAGLVIQSLLGVLRSKVDEDRCRLMRYLWLAQRLSTRADFAGTLTSCLLWVVIGSGPILGGFKLAWFAAALLAAHATARPMRSRYRHNAL